jgi:hypothetical protein
MRLPKPAAQLLAELQDGDLSASQQKRAAHAS